MRGPWSSLMARILLIDDSASVREALRVALESEGYRVYNYGNPPTPGPGA
jgi:CheY-like chemotaxis protein